MNADYLPIQVGREPLFPGEGSAQCYFYASRQAIDAIADSGPAWKLYDATLIRHALTHPEVIFEGLRHEQFEDGYCYSVKPPAQFIAGIPLPKRLSQSFVFLVFVKREQGLVVFDWAWRKESSDKPGFPNAWETDFTRGIVWPKPISP